MRRVLVSLVVSLCACPSFDDALAQCRNAGRCVTEGLDASISADAGLNDAGQPDASVLDAGGNEMPDAGGPQTTLMVSPLQLGFGTLAVNDLSPSQPLTIHNGPAEATNLRVTLPTGFFRANTSNCTSQLRANESCVMQIIFNPNLAAAFDAMGSVLADNAPALAFRVTGTGVNSSIVMRPANLDFGLLALGTSASRDIELKNEGSVPLTSLSISLESDAGVYTLTNDTCGTTLNSMAVCKVHVDLSTSSPGHFEGAIVANASPGATRRASLTAQTGAMLTLNVAGGMTDERVITDGTSDGGLRCDTRCQTLVPHGEKRTIRLESTTRRTQLALWSEACSGRGECTVTVDGATSVSARAVSNNFIFVTSNSYTGALGGNAGANAICNAHALDAGMPNEEYVALIAPFSAIVQEVLPLLMPNEARGWVRPDGKPFVDSQEDLDLQRTFYPPFLDEYGVRLSTRAIDGGQAFDTLWSGIAAAGNKLVVNTETESCLSGSVAWASTLRAGATGSVFNQTWFGRPGDVASCGERRHLLCAGITQTDAGLAPIAPSNARRMFLSMSPSITSADSRASLEAWCTAEAQDAGLRSDAGFAPLRAELGAAASAGFSLDGGPWYRIDNVAAFDPASELVSPRGPMSTLDLQPDGTHGTQVGVWLGALDLVTPANSDTSCYGWSLDVAKTRKGLYGQVGYAVPGLAPSEWPCTYRDGFPYRGSILCLER